MWDCSIFLGRLAVQSSDRGREREREREGQAEIRIRTEVFWDCLILIALLSRIERGSSWSEKADPWKTVPASHVGSFDHPMNTPSAPHPSPHIVKGALISHQSLHALPSFPNKFQLQEVEKDCAPDHL